MWRSSPMIKNKPLSSLLMAIMTMASPLFAQSQPSSSQVLLTFKEAGRSYNRTIKFDSNYFRFTGDLLTLQNAGGLADPGGNGVLKRISSGITALVTGTATDCVKVDGTSGACGSAGGSNAPVIPVKTNATTLTIPLAGKTYKCSGVLFPFTVDSTLIVSASQTGDARMYVSCGAGGTAAGTVTAAYQGMTAPSGSGITAVAGTDYPNPANQIAQWHANSGVWDATALVLPAVVGQEDNFLDSADILFTRSGGGISATLANAGGSAMLDTSIGTNTEVDDEFYSGYGNLGWTATKTLGGDSFPATAEVAHPGINAMQVTTAAGSEVQLTINAGGPGKQTILPGTGGGFTALKYSYWFKTDAVLDYAFGFGLTTSDIASTAGAGVGVVFNPGTTNCTTGGSTTQFSFLHKNVGNSHRTCIPTGLTVLANTWYKATISSTGTSTVSFSITPYGGSTVTGSEVVDFPTQVAYNSIQVSQVAGQAAARTLFIDKFHFRVAGLARTP
jgi:archaellum component FlaG (FlaF/FlaG flagellin family)